MRNVSFIINNISDEQRDTIFAVKFVSRDETHDTTICARDLSVREKFTQYEDDDVSHAANLQRDRNAALHAFARRVKQINAARAKLHTLCKSDILVSDKQESDEA